jgi:hypothetical protein
MHSIEHDARFIHLPATAMRAKALGDVYFFTGKRCKKGHLSHRYTSSNNCVECIAEKRGQVGINYRGRSSKRSEENQQRAQSAIDAGHMTYTSSDACPKGHVERFVTTNNCTGCAKANDKRRGNVIKWKRIEKVYGLTRDAFAALLSSQQLQCCICRCALTEATSHIDHCHKTSRVRGLLCGPCNRGIGIFKDDISRIENAIKYLRGHQC